MEQKSSRGKGGKRELKKLKMEGKEKEKGRSKKREGGLQRRREEEKGDELTRRFDFLEFRRLTLLLDFLVL